MQAHYVAETLQRIDADVVLVNEFDYDLNRVAGTSSVPSPLGYVSVAHQQFNDGFLSATHGGGGTGRTATSALDYDHGYTPTTNTGLASGLDLDNNGVVGGGNDAFGFGNFRGAVRLHDLLEVRDHQRPHLPELPVEGHAGQPAQERPHGERPRERLLARGSRGAAPVFDGPEDRNGKRNFDEIRFWKDCGNGASYTYDDQGGTGGLGSGALFVIAGDCNADLCDGDSFKVACTGRDQPGVGPNAIGQLLLDPFVNTRVTPASAGGTAAATDPSNNGPIAQTRTSRWSARSTT